MTRTINTWSIGDYDFREVRIRYTPTREDTYYEFSVRGNRNNELFTTIDEALVAAVGFKFTGRRGASGSNVGTAADWFLRMIGAAPAPRREGE